MFVTEIIREKANHIECAGLCVSSANIVHKENILDHHVFFFPFSFFSMSGHHMTQHIGI